MEVASEEPAQPLNATEKVLSKLVSSVMGMPLGAEEFFFENGMNSVSGAIFVSRCRKDQGWVFVSFSMLCRENSIRLLGKAVDRQKKR